MTREKQTLLIAAQNNAIRTNYNKTEVDDTQKNNKVLLCDDKDETVNSIIM